MHLYTGTTHFGKLAVSLQVLNNHTKMEQENMKDALRIGLFAIFVPRLSTMTINLYRTSCPSKQSMHALPERLGNG